MKKVYIILACFALFAGCKPETSNQDDIIDEQTYEHMFIEFAIINQLDERLLKNTSREELRNKVYQHYGVSQEEFRISHEYYEQNIDEQLKRVNEINKMLRAERDSVQAIQRRYEAISTPEQLEKLRQSLSEGEN